MLEIEAVIARNIAVTYLQRPVVMTKINVITIFFMLVKEKKEFIEFAIVIGCATNHLWYFRKTQIP